MIAAKRHDPAPPAEVNHCLEDVATVGATADVVAEEDDRVDVAGLHQSQQTRQGIGVAVNVADGDGAGTRHGN